MSLLIFTAALTDARLAALALVLLGVASANAETCDDLEAAKRATYGFRLSQLSSQEQGPMTQFADGQHVASATATAIIRSLPK